MTVDRTEHLRRLLHELFGELWTAERAAQEHGDRQARLLVAGPAAEAMAAISEHAELALDEMRVLARVEGLPDGSGAAQLGGLVALLRHTVTDRALDRERSYRTALVDARAGVDIVTMMRHVADDSGRLAIAGFCARWTSARTRHVAAAEKALAWFVSHPTAAIERPTIRSLLRV